MKKNNQKENFKKIDIALKSNRLYAFLMGIGIYKLEGGNIHDGITFNPGAIMNTLYNYCQNKYNISSEVQRNLELLANIKSFEAIYCVLTIEMYQLQAEKNNISPFQLNHIKILNTLKNNITVNKEFYSMRGELDGHILENGMIGLIAKYDNDLYQKYGHKIL